MTNTSEFVLRGRISTQSGLGQAEAVHVRAGLVVAVGDHRLGDELARAGVREVGVPAGGLAIPALIDSHVHLTHYSVGSDRGVDCRVPVCTGISDVIERLRERAEATPHGEWVIGYGNLFFDQKLAERRYPTRQELDQASSDHPIVLHGGGHVSLLNSRALELIDVKRFLGPGQGLWGSPIVELDRHGEPTGYVAEIDAHLGIPEPPVAEITASVKRRFHTELLSRGVVTVGEMVETEDQLSALEALVSDEGFGGRIAMYAMSPGFRSLDDGFEWITRYERRADLLWAQGVKLFADGGYSARNAASLQEYSAEQVGRAHYRGVLNKSRDELLRAFALSEAHGVQLAIHANGTRAQAEVLHALIDFGRRIDVRVEHLGNVLEDDGHLDLWKRAGVKAAMQPGFLASFIGDYVPMLFPGAGVSGRMPLRTILDSSIHPSISSDFGLGADVGSTNPWRTMWACVARQSFWGLTVEPHESIGVHEALRAHTVDAAAAIGRAGDLGSLECGKIADIAVLDRNPLAVELEDLRETRALETYRAGRLVHAEER